MTQKKSIKTPVPGEILDPSVVEFEGSKPQLDLLSDIVNSPMPVVDPSEPNGFNAQEHIVIEFIEKINVRCLQGSCH